MSFTVFEGDALARLATLEPASVNCCITSPPYWGLRDYGIAPTAWSDGSKCALGLESDPDAFLAHMVEVFRHVRRVLHPSATLWMNMGDSYSCGKPRSAADCAAGGMRWSNEQSRRDRGLKAKELMMMPARVALALQADGWTLRQQIPWLKRNPMPESVTDRPTSAVEYVYLFGVGPDAYYDREAVRVAASGNAHGRGDGVNPKAHMEGKNSRINRDRDPAHQTPAKIRAKQNRSFSAAVRNVVLTRARRNSDWFFESWQGMLPDEDGDPLAFVINPQPFGVEACAGCEACYKPREYRQLAEAEREDGTKVRVCTCGAREWVSHFATFPGRLVEPMILAGTSEAGCCAQCSAPYVRVVERQHYGDWHPNSERGHRSTTVNRIESKASPHGTRAASGTHDQPFRPPETLGWEPSCSHPLFPGGAPVPCTVLDPFSGSGRTGLVAAKLGRHFIGCEANPHYVRIARFQHERMAV